MCSEQCICVGCFANGFSGLVLPCSSSFFLYFLIWLSSTIESRDANRRGLKGSTLHPKQPCYWQVRHGASSSRLSGSAV